MLFHSRIFLFAFGPITITVFWLLKNPRLRRLWLAVMSIIFYGYWNWKFASLLLISTIINFSAGLLMEANDNNNARRKLWFVLSVILNLGILGFFKYYVLLALTANTLSGNLGGPQILPPWHIILPIGISFFTFQALSYSIDVYRRDVDVTRDFVEFAAYIALFPQLIAGPIVRYSEIRRTLRNLPKKLTVENLNVGLFYFTVGMAKKVLIADRIAYFINPLFADYHNLLPVQAWLAIIGYSLQLYFDFAGYSLMAIGLGHLMGFEFPWNFNSPYKAVSISDFWRRWHMTLSRWLRDYLYIPLGGRNNRAVALAVTMLLGGLWHGAYWTFMAWGAYHAILLEMHHHFKKFKWFPRNIIWARTGTFLLVTIGWVFFRPPTFEASWTILAKMFNIPGLFQQVTVPAGLILLIVIALAWAMFMPNAVEIVREKKMEPKPAWAVGLGILFAVCILLLSETGPFLYFQF